ncbi:MAG: sodium/proton-translocating pyrophosphatase, partial [Methanocellales archaeon]|nr:sodium/proton-translocating pyrophosphatase [Methanocellales archaeon]
MELELLALIISIVGLAFAAFLRLSIIRQDAGTPEMKEISQSIRKGAMAFLRREFITLAIFTLITFFILALFIEPRPGVALAYLFGTATSAIAGFLGMDIATRANTRTANSAVGSWANALKIAFSSGAVMGFCVVGLGLFGLTVVSMLSEDSHVWLGFAFGASSVALFLRVGGGIFTKSADVGSDLVGKVEKDLPEDDPRNAAVIADLVGDNVGDIAG